MNPGVSAHVMNAVGFNSNICSPINQDISHETTGCVCLEERKWHNVNTGRKTGESTRSNEFYLLMPLAGRAELQQLKAGAFLDDDFRFVL